MAKKDPAFLFYSQDFFMGTIGMSMDERGQYITLLCLQHQKGHLDDRTIRSALLLPEKKPLSAFTVMSKFAKDKDGNWYNRRLDEEIKRREEYARSRSEIGKKGGRPRKENPEASENHTETLCFPYENHKKSTDKSIAKACENHSKTFSFSFSSNNNNNNITGAPARVEKPSFEEVAEEMDRLGAANPHIQASIFIEKNDNDGWRCLSMLGGWRSAADAWMNALFDKEAHL